MIHLSRVPRAALALLGVAACTTITLPGDVPERYALIAVDGHAVPALADTSSNDFGYILSDTIAFDGQGGVDRRFRFRRVQPSLNSDVTGTSAFTQGYRLGPDDRVEIGWFSPCPPNALCVANEVGTRSSTEMVLSATFYAYGHRLTFRRVE